MTKSCDIYWFGSDLRLDDNHLLSRAAQAGRPLLFVYVVDRALKASNRYQLRGIGAAREKFLLESLACLREQLASLDQTLLVVEGDPVKVIGALIERCSATTVYRGEQVGWDEWSQWRQVVAQSSASISWQSGWQHTLLQPNQLPFSVEQLPNSFSKFRRAVEPLFEMPLQPPSDLPTAIDLSDAESYLVDAQIASKVSLTPPTLPSEEGFVGGKAAAWQHLQSYFSSPQPACYKVTRNALSDWPSSTKFSPWLALGVISPRQVAAQVRQYEAEHGANDSTYWILFELLWRDYFQFYSYRYGKKLFTFGGIENRSPLTSFYPQRFAAWCHGRTAYPLVNAAMNELRATGYLSNRARQIVASCLVNELQLDWRYGAAFFEQQLVDYDVASNWGNWQYIAGVGADPRGGRHFSIEKQTSLYDPQGEYIAQWQGEAERSWGDAVDLVDWPRELH